jgi:FAD:protein FMN transferase
MHDSAAELGSRIELTREADHWVGRFAAMASPCEVLIEAATESLARQVTHTAAACAWRIDHKFSRYRSDNIVHEINSSAGRAVVVDEETAGLIDFAATLTKLSAGRFDITSGVLRRIWSFDGGSRVPTQEQIDEVLALVGWHLVDWRKPLLRLRPGMQIDFGGIGKEYAVDMVATLVEAIAPGLGCLINFGGDVVARNPRRDGHPWRVGIEAAGRAGAAATIVHLQNGGLATSGDLRRFVLHDGRRLSHILDARTGRPVENAARSITVAADTCTQAGTFTTLAMLQGPDAIRFLQASGMRHWIQ